MANITIITNISRPVTIHAPAHCLVHLSSNAMHLTDLPVTSCALQTGSNVRLVGIKRIRLRLDPVNSSPGRLLLALGVGRELLNFRALGLDRFVTTHAGGYVWNRRVRRLVDIFVTEGAFELRRFVALFRDVLPVIELNRLFWGFGLARRAHKQHADQYNRQRKED